MGPPVIELDNRSINLETRKATALLAYLSCIRQDHSREILATLFWPEYSQDRALANLRRTLSSLNQTLPIDILAANRETIGLQAKTAVWLDIEAFKGEISRVKLHHPVEEKACADCLVKLEQAAALYRGDFLTGLNLPDCIEFDSWQIQTRESLRRELVWILERLVTAYASQEKWEPAIQYAQRFVSLDRLHEPAQRTFIDLLARSGQRSAAIRQANAFIQLLQDELGQSPEAKTLQLYHRIRSSDQITGTGMRNAPCGQSTSEKGPSFNSGQIIEPLLKTKLYIPMLRNPAVNRPRLVERMNRGTEKALTLVSAPAGFGKTTLLATWAAHVSLPVAWISLDAADNDSNRFLSYLVTALDSIQEDVGREVLQLIHSAQILPSTTLLTILLNDLNAISESFVLVLDDYHVIQNLAIHEAIIYILEHLPPAMHIVIVSRTDPPLLLARLRARNQYVELRAEELRFTPAETAEFLNRVMRLNLSEPDIASLERRTEGWVVGLQMAALSMQGVQDVSHFVQTFSGSNRYLLDYLIEEVLNRQSEGVQVFLMRTSILDRLCGSLCDAVLGQVTGTTAQVILEKLEKENLFLISLDDELRWFRYHHLFSDLLRNRLGHLHHEDLPGLHLRASEWYEANQGMEEAVNHALLAGDIERSGRLINQMARPLINQSGTFTLQRWIQQLPQDYVRTQPWLCISLAWAHGFMGQLDKEEEYLQEAETHILPEDPPFLQQEWNAHILTLRSFIANTRGDLAQTIRLANQALALIPTENVASRLSVGYNLGRAYLSLGEFDRSAEVLWETARLSMQAGISQIIGPDIAALSRVYRLQGRLHETVDKLRDLQIYLEGHHPESIYAAGNAYLGTIDVLREWNQLEQAETLARRTLESLESWKSHNSSCACATLLARILQAQGRFEEARLVLQSATEMIQINVPFIDIRIDLNSAWVKYWLVHGELPLAEQWMKEWMKTQTPGKVYTISTEQDEITLSRVLIAKQKLPEANQILSRLAEAAQAGGRFSRLIEVMALTAVALNAQGKASEALKGLEKCLILAEPEGYVRVFLDLGSRMANLLILGKEQRVWNTSPLREYVDHLLNAFEKEKN